MAKQQLKQAYISLAALLLFLTLTDPKRLPLALHIVPIGLTMVTVYLLIKVLVAHIMPRSKSASTVVSLLGASLVALIVILRSLDQLSLQDAIIFIVLFVLLSIYVYRTSAS